MNKGEQMNFKIFLNKKADVQAENRLLRFVVTVIGIVVLFNTVMIQRSLNYQRVIIVPPGLDVKAEIRGDYLDKNYVMAFSRYVSGLAFNYTPATVKRQFEELLTLFAPEAYAAGKTTFYNLAENVIETRSNSSFYIDRVSIDTVKKRVEVFGVRRLYIDDRKVEDLAKTYLIEYKINNGKFSILSVSETGDGNGSTGR